MSKLWRALRQQSYLQLASQRQVTLQASLLPCDFFIQARILDGDRHLCRQRREGALMLLGEKTTTGMLEVKYTDYLVLVDERDGHFRSGLGVEFHVTRVLGYVRHQYCLFALHCRADHASFQGNVMLQMNVLVKAQREPMLQFLAGRIEQQDAEHLVVDEAAQQFGNAS